jgi:hypothetical protein
MSGNAAVRAGRRLRGQVYRRAEHPHLIPIEEEGAARLVADQSYIRVGLSEFWLAADRSWAFDRRPVVKASARVLFGKPDQRQPGATNLERQEFAVLITPEAGRGVVKDYPITEWIPYQGQQIELKAALYSVPGKNRLLPAIDILAEFASLVTPPISAALAIADRVSAGIEKAIRSNGAEPVLPLHTSLTAPGWVVVVGATEDHFPRAELGLDDNGQLCRNGRPLTGHNYLVLRVQSCQERDDWRTPDLNMAINAALDARDNEGAKEVYERRRAEALSKIYLSLDFTTGQRKKLAKVVREELDDTSYGAVGGGGVTLAEIVGRRGLPDDREVEFLTLDKLIAR